jgi:hypothetical protein
MAFRLSEYVTGGMVINKGDYSTYGCLALRGLSSTLRFELTGYPADDLRGKRIEFEVPENDRPVSPEDVSSLAKLKISQVGPTGWMTAARRIRTGTNAAGDGSAQEELCLMLEWFGQNGRVVVELPLSTIRFLSDEEMAERDRLEREAMEEAYGERPTTEPRSDEVADAEDPFGLFAPEVEMASEPGFGLIPEEFEHEMERRRGRRIAKSRVPRSKFQTTFANWNCWMR